MSSVLHPLKRFYGSGRFGKPFGIDLREVVEAIDARITRLISRKQFTYQRKAFPYFYHHYNHASDNERTVEIPLIKSLVNKKPPSKILEVGNVLSHYQTANHTVVDKYEQAPSVINEDAANYKSLHKFDLIVSISTLEHIGFDEPEKDPQKIKVTIQNLISLLAPSGKFVFTVPIGANPHLDKCIKQNQLGITRARFLRRINHDNEWAECDKQIALTCRYNSPFPYANAIMIGEYENVSKAQ